ncbi:MAG TPA: hypothetical protein VGC56_14015 [Allosphingosinicella sp.]|jgi:hypothetical protein
MAGERLHADAVNAALAVAGGAILFLAWRMDGGWAERHFLPAWAYPWETQLRILFWLRLAVAAAGLIVLLLIRPRIAHAVAQGRGRQALVTALTSVAAVAAAFLVVEGILHTRSWRSTQERWDKEEPLRARDADYGWTFAENHAGTVALHGRTVHYATGPHGYRIPSPGAAPDFARPTIVFAGESILLGYGLEWPETIPAQVQAITGVQVADTAVNAHAADQTYLRLRRELPRFEKPVAVVIPFVPALFDRNLDTDRPHLDAQLRWHPADPPSFRLVELARRIVRYRSSSAITEGTAKTQEVLRRMVAMAEARGARAVVVVPQFLPESEREAQVRRAVLDGGHIPYLLVPIRPEWRFRVDRHPTPQAARVIAEAVARAVVAPKPKQE